MVRRCCVSSCKNGGTDCDEKISFFKVPNEQDLFEKWARAIEQTGSSLSKSSAICERHFRKDEIKRENILRDSFGNVIFQRPLTKFSLNKEAIPSIFDENFEEQTLGKKRKKRKTLISDFSDFINTGNFIIGNEGNLNVNCSNILVALNEKQNNVKFNIMSNNLPSDLTLSDVVQKDGEYNYENNMENINETLETTKCLDYYINGHTNTYINGTVNGSQIKNYQDKHENNVKVTEDLKSIISIYIKPHHEEGRNNFNGFDNINRNEALNFIGTSFINEELVTPKIFNQSNIFNGLNLETPKEVTIIIPNDEIIILNESNNNMHNINTQRNVQTKLDTLHYPLPETNIQMNIRSFDIIFYNSHKITLPNSMWGYHKNIIDKDIIIFSKAKWFKSDVLIPPIYEKQVIFHESDNIKIYINNKFSPLEVRRPKDVYEMELILKSVDEIVVCCGGPNIGECDTAHCAQKDYAVNKWRHKLCPIILMPGESMCKFCSTINQVVRYPKKKRFAFGRRNIMQ